MLPPSCSRRGALRLAPEPPCPNSQEEAVRLVRTLSVYAGDHLLAEETALYERSEYGMELTLSRKTLTDDISDKALFSEENFSASLTDRQFAATLPDFSAVSAAEDAGGEVSLSVSDPAAFLGGNAAQASAFSARAAFDFGRPSSLFISYSLPNTFSVTLLYAFSY